MYPRRERSLIWLDDQVHNDDGDRLVPSENPVCGFLTRAVRFRSSGSSRTAPEGVSTLSMRTPMARLARVAVLVLSPVLVAASATGCATTKPPSRPTADCVQSTFDGMSEQARVGQLFMVGMPASGPDPATSAMIKRSSPGGVYFSGRTKAGAADVAQGSAEAQQASNSVPLFVGVDQEGGKVQPLSGPGFSAIPPGAVQGQWSPEQLRAAASSWGRELHAAGVNVDLAPIGDTLSDKLGKANPPIGKFDRAFSTDPAVVASHVKAFVEGMQSAGVSTSVKHFPGLGRVLGNTDVDDHVSDNETAPDDPNMLPFEEGVRTGSTFMMSSSASYPRIDPSARAVFSPATLQGLVRDKLNFQGLIISDDLGVAKEVSNVPVGQRAVDFVAAGGDVVLTAKPQTVSPMIDAVVARSHSDPRFAALLGAAERRVLETKGAHHLLPCSASR